MRYDTFSDIVTTPRTIADAAAALRAGTLTARALLDETVAAVDRHADVTNAFILIDAERARQDAERVDDERRRGVDRGPLHGIPISIKDLIDVAGWPTTAASLAMPASSASADAPLVARLRDAGAVLFGKTNLHEFALGTTSDESAWGAVRHPADSTRSAGGSSGGSAAAVATGMGLASIGTDTGGSIRIPASACGVVGLKPGFGEVSLRGVVPLSTSLDHAGPLARTVMDAAMVWTALTGHHAEAPAAPAGLRLGLLGGHFAGPLAPEVRSACALALDRLRAAGVIIVDVECASASRLPEAYVDLVLPEAAHWHAAHVRPTAGAGYQPGVGARLARGADIPAVRYLAAQTLRDRFRLEVDAALADVDVLVTVTLPITAPLLGQDVISIDTAGPADTPVRSAMLKHTQPFNMSGHPAISIPLVAPGLPAGLQLVGRMGGTSRLLAVAGACERLLQME
jgi:aspartyl-tRNA(Asn)/glutamyl-tRNA(Gln) amidotransferase subunit A